MHTHNFLLVFVCIAKVVLKNKYWLFYFLKKISIFVSTALAQLDTLLYTVKGVHKSLFRRTIIVTNKNGQSVELLHNSHRLTRHETGTNQTERLIWDSPGTNPVASFKLLLLKRL